MPTLPMSVAIPKWPTLQFPSSISAPGTAIRSTSGLTVRQFGKTITDYCQIADRVQKPVLLEEFGYARSNRDSAEAYAGWLDTLARDPDCAGWLVWRLVSLQDHGRYPADEHDQFDVHNDASPIWNVLKAATSRAVKVREAGRIPVNSLRETP
jgi:mannan endo-1,4-beta-mannosidase